MPKTYRPDSSQPGQTTYVDINNVDNQLSISAKRSTSTTDGVRVPLIRGSIVLTVPVLKSNVGCQDKCGPQALYTRMTRVEFSNPDDSVGMLADIVEIQAILAKVQADLIKGILPNKVSDIVVD